MASISGGAGGRVKAAAVLVPIALVVVLTAVLAWRAWDAGRAHRELARRTVADYADFAAAIVASGAEAEIARALFYAFRPVELAEQEGRGRPVAVSDLPDNEQENRRCAADDGPVPETEKWYARLDSGSGEVDAVGPLPPEARPALSRALRGLAADEDDDSTRGHLFLPLAGDGRLVAYRIRRDADGHPTAVHATASCFRSRNGPAFDLALEGATVLPPGLVGDGPVDSLLSTTVRAPGGELLHRSRATYASEFSGTHRSAALGPLGGVEVGVTLRDNVGRALVTGGIPPSPLPLVLGLLLLAALLAGGTVLQLRRAVGLVRARERFVADVSHELRTPLQQILLYVQLLRMGRAGDEEERREALRVTERETLRLIHLVDRVLSFTQLNWKGGDEGSEDDAGPAAVASVLTEVVEGYRPVAETRGVELRLKMTGDAELKVSSEPDAIRRIAVNLLENAVRYGPEGQTVRVELRRAEDTARIVVEDQGPGIPEEERSRVWEPFRRLENGSGAGATGTGIGLAIVRELVEAAGGEAWIEDAGAGARVVVELPVVSEAARTVEAKGGA